MVHLDKINLVFFCIVINESWQIIKILLQELIFMLLLIALSNPSNHYLPLTLFKWWQFTKPLCWYNNNIAYLIFPLNVRSVNLSGIVQQLLQKVPQQPSICRRRIPIIRRFGWRRGAARWPWRVQTATAHRAARAKMVGRGGRRVGWPLAQVNHRVFTVAVAIGGWCCCG